MSDTSAPAAAGACKIRPTPLDPCPFHADKGQVTIEIVDVFGSVQFRKADYDGVAIPGLPSKQITFTIVAGQKNLDVQYVFTDTVNGQGTVQEVCTVPTSLVHA